MAFDAAPTSADPVDVHVGARIRQLRQARGLSQQNLAAHLGLTHQQVQKYELGTNRISGSKLYAACQLLACRPDDLFQGLPLGDTAAETADQAAARLALTRPNSVALLAAYDRLHPDDQLVLLALARRLGAEA